ncbi:Putative respiratory burst oxidase-like protein G [Durusdinium trenchii]|uniref:Respiratory burst oxidase-like protein G n=1 Tax=Durusdinium trenchii TaxID=1381693 RepID=A0ABP0Q2Q9_9DINO
MLQWFGSAQEQGQAQGCGSPVIGKELSKQSHQHSDMEGPGATRFSFFKDRKGRCDDGSGKHSSGGQLVGGSSASDFLSVWHV